MIIKKTIIGFIVLSVLILTITTIGYLLSSNGILIKTDSNYNATDTGLDRIAYFADEIVVIALMFVLFPICYIIGDIFSKRSDACVECKRIRKELYKLVKMDGSLFWDDVLDVIEDKQKIKGGMK